MNKNGLTVLQGGLLNSANIKEKRFVSSYVTNTRLMGVLGMYIHWELPEDDEHHDYHQFFYFDAEEYGFETYHSVLGNDLNRIVEIENTLIGGLGGEQIPITMREAQFLFQEYSHINLKLGIPFPDGYDEYAFLMGNSITLTAAETEALMEKQCVTLHSPYEALNYFLMRCFGKDFSAAGYLASHKVNLELFPDYQAATFCKNSIDAGKAPGEYLCESLIETEDNYYLTVTSLTLDHMRISTFERISSFKVSPSEAALMLSRSEFVCAYEMVCGPDEFTKDSSRLASTSMVTAHDQGTLFMIFHENNSHVDKREYRINEDILGMYYVSHFGQLITAAYTLDDTRRLETDLSTSTLGRKLIPVARYEFREPILYEYIQSGFDDFELFIEAIKTEE